MQYIGQIAQEQSVRVEELMADSGGGTCVIRRDNFLSSFVLYDRRIEEDVHFTLDPIPTAPNWRTRWGGKVIGVNARRSSEGLHTVELELVSNREHLKHILAGCNPIFPPEVQLPKLFLFPWNCRTAFFITMLLNLARQYCPLLSIPTNPVNPGGWIHSGAGFFGFDPLAWPIQPQFVNPLFDQSRFSIMASRWSDMHTVMAPILEDAGCMIRAYTWLTEDKDSPHPELTTAMGGVFDEVDKLSRPHRNCIIMACEDKSGTTGPTGTFADGPIKLIARTADDLITQSIVPLLPGDIGRTPGYYEPGMQDIAPFFQKLAMVAPEPPWVIFRDGEYSGIVESQRSLHAASAKTIMTGGRSPGWVNARPGPAQAGTGTLSINYVRHQIRAVHVVNNADVSRRRRHGRIRWIL
jgi:hypothetical protein